MIVLGLTGSIGMGKSTVARMFREAGVPVNDADEVVHRLYAGRTAPLVEAAFPGVVEAGAVDRERLSKAVLGNPEALLRLEAIVHPLVRQEEQTFLQRFRRAGHPLVVLDVPLLFEVGAESRVDRILVVSASPETQAARVLARPGMTAEKFAAILQRQLPDTEKRRRANYVIDTSLDFETTRAAVTALIARLVDEDRGQEAGDVARPSVSPLSSG